MEAPVAGDADVGGACVFAGLQAETDRAGRAVRGPDPLVRDEFVETLIDRAPETTILISTHDLAEIETFATHIGLLEEGRLMFSEERGALAGRMREVDVTFAEPPAALPAPCPQSWLNPQLSGAVLCSVEAAFGGDRSVDGLAGVRHVEYCALTLRAMFVELVKAAQKTS